MNYFAGMINKAIPDDSPLMLAAFVWDFRNFDTEDDLRAKLATYRALTPNGIVGCCRSALYFTPTEKEYNHPKSIAPIEQWCLRDADSNLMFYPGTDDQPIFDYADPAVRARIVMEAIAESRKWGFDAICWDNVRYNIPAGKLVNPAVKAGISYTETTEHFVEFFKFCRQACDAYGLKVFANIGVSATSVIPDAIKTFGPYLDGVMFEPPFYPDNLTPERFVAERQAYRQALEAGKYVLLFPTTKGSEEELRFMAVALEQELRDYPGKLLFCKKGTFDNSDWYYFPEIKK